ncbi:Microtubule-associated protein 70-5 [Citrus sinensis]|uniref:Microtubule-associated protein 70-5 n=1 Tax=Citrus sinensis TaxID=2711 RepID=A0ACB8NJ97_CITSI|nr:Microtubule-associated protein 70-5 [Citrus sinensis]
MVGFDELKLGGVEELSLAHPDPVVLELNRLQNQLKEKDRELADAQGEIKALRATEVLKDKAIEELRNEFGKIDGKLRVTQNVLEHRNLEIKKVTGEKKDALAAQYAAEATLRRVHANLKDDDSVPIESVLAPLEADIKTYKKEIAALQEDKKALQRHTKAKEMALLEAEKILRSALERALIVEEEENRILEKTNRQKVLEVEKLSGTIKELEEAVLAGGSAANAIRDYQRQITELNEEKRTLERELARVKVSANRVATVVANEWKDENDKVMPVRQWLEERRLLQVFPLSEKAEMQRLKDKLAISERTAKAEAQLKEKLKLRLKTLEEGLKHVSSFSGSPNTFCGSPKTEKSSNIILGFLTANGGLRKRSTSQPRASTISRNSLLHQPNSENATVNGNFTGGLKRADSFRKKCAAGENVLRKSIWPSKNKVVDSSCGKENTQVKENKDNNIDEFKIGDTNVSVEVKNKVGGYEHEVSQNKGNPNPVKEDVVSGFLYDRLQKEVILLRKFCESKDSCLNAKDEEIKMLIRKVDALTKAIEAESKKIKREAAAREKEAISAKLDDTRKIRSTSSSRSRVNKAP